MNDTLKFVLGAATVVIVSGLLVKKAAAKTVDVVSNINEDTPFEGFGPIGTLGHATDSLLFGLPSKLGSFIGTKIADIQGI